jgi:hypothetical protein
MRYLSLLGLGLLAPGIAVSQGDKPALEGPVTRFTSPSDFSVSHQRMNIRPDTQFRLLWPDRSSVVAKQPVKLFIGEHVALYPTEHGDSAARVDILQPDMHAVDGLATVEAVLPGKDLEVRADGYRIHIRPETYVKYEKPFTAASDIKPNAVLKYKGMLQEDGTVFATTATFSGNNVSTEVLDTRKAWDEAPSAVPVKGHQSGASRAFRGTDTRYFALHKDAAMQARISAIGEKLVPEYQRKMKPDDSAWIHFRFYVVDAPKSKEAYYPLPSGIILMPYQVIQKLPDDSQLAAVLADAVACLIEAQPIALPQTNGQMAGHTAVKAAEVGAIGVVGVALVGVPAQIQARKDAEQRARVSLSLVRNAGFDETAAPTAWGALPRDESRPRDEVMPPMVAYLYKQIAEHQAAEAVGLVGKRR